MVIKFMGDIEKIKKKLNVLIVDDDLLNFIIYEKIIKVIGGILQIVNNGEEVVIIYCDGGLFFDFILMDKEMFERDGVLV